jgi:hypothetical protein
MYLMYPHCLFIISPSDRVSNVNEGKSSISASTNVNTKSDDGEPIEAKATVNVSPTAYPVPAS